MLSFLVLAVLQAGILGFVISPGTVAGETPEQVFPHIFVFRSDEAKAQKKGTEGKGGILADLGFAHHRPALVDGLRGNRQCQRDVCPHLTGMEGAFKTAPFQRTPVEWML